MMVKSSKDKKFFIIEENLKLINEKIAQVAIKSGRDIKDIHLMAVTKTVEPQYINHAIDCGIKLIGENRVQEYLGKEDNLKLNNCDVHLIGHLQTNKVKKIVDKVSLIQSVDSIKVAKEISKCSKRLGITTQILLEVNIGGEASKYGLKPEALLETIEEIAQFDGVKICGLMTIPPICDNKEQSRTFFYSMNKLFIDIRGKKIDNVSMDILSMGMSDDYTQAILEGSNLIRIGSGIFGSRIYK